MIMLNDYGHRLLLLAQGFASSQVCYNVASPTICANTTVLYNDIKVKSLYHNNAGTKSISSRDCW